MQETISYTDRFPTRDVEMNVCGVIGSGECIEIRSGPWFEPRICDMVHGPNFDLRWLSN